MSINYGEAATAASLFASVGATLGSVVPGIGTAIGGAVGGVVGAAASFVEQAVNNDDVSPDRDWETKKPLSLLHHN